MKAYIYKLNPPHPRRLIAIFHDESEAHAYMHDARVTRSQPIEVEVEVDHSRSRSCSSTHARTSAHTPTYTPTSIASLQVDLSAAKPTKRPIVYNLSYHIHEQRRHYLAYHRLYGVIRGQVSDDEQGRRLFISRLTTIWPNATIAS